MILRRLFWVFYAVFVAGALYFNWEQGPFRFNGPLAGVKALIWVGFVGFTAYSVYCSGKEDLFKTIGAVNQYYWGRQIGIDLYLGLGLTLFFVYLHEQSISVLLIWLVPVLFYANQLTLLYVAIHFDAIVARFLF